VLISESVLRIRRIIRDTDSSIFTDTTIINLWNEVQNEFAGITRLLERAINLSVPGIALFTFTQRWEEDYTAKPAAILYNFMSSYSYTQPWELSSTVGVESTVAGGYTGSQMWESFYVDTQNRLFHYFPDDFIDPSFMAYDEKPIEWIFRTEIDRGNTAFKTRSGLNPYVYIEDRESKLFYLYPRVDEVYGITDIDKDIGEVVYDTDTSNDTINPSTDYGVIVFGDGTELDSDYGLVVRYQVAPDALHLIYYYLPIVVTSGTQIIEWPRWVVKYIEYGVLARLFKMETDLANDVLAKFYVDRFYIGLSIVEHYKAKLRTMRTYRMGDIQNAKPGGNRKLADLPSHYPSLWR